MREIVGTKRKSQVSYKRRFLAFRKSFAIVGLDTSKSGEGFFINTSSV